MKVIWQNFSATVVTEKWYFQLTWPFFQFNHHGFQIIADTALRIDTKRHAYGLSILGSGIGIAKRNPYGT